MNDIKLKITGMTCAHCVQAVTKALDGVADVEKAEVKLWKTARQSSAGRRIWRR
jgi:copper chaperone CopZ